MAHGADVAGAGAVLARALCFDADQPQGGLDEGDPRGLWGALAVGARMLPRDGGGSGSQDDADGYVINLYEFDILQGR